MDKNQYKAHINGLYQFELEVRDGKHFLNGEEVMYDATSTPEGETHVVFNGKSRTVEVVSVDRDADVCEVLVDGRRFTVAITDAYDALLESMGIEKSGARKVKEVKAPMPGLVLEVAAKPGDEVEEGETLLILEAMKMENALKSPASGKVKSINATQGEAVEKGVVLVEFE